MNTHQSMDCPECGKPLKAKKSWGGLLACYCRWGGRCPSGAQIEKTLKEYDSVLERLCKVHDTYAEEHGQHPDNLVVTKDDARKLGWHVGVSTQFYARVSSITAKVTKFS